MSRRTKKVLYFVMLTYIITLLFYLILQVIGGKSSPIAVDLLGVPMILPFISVIIVQKFIFKQKLKGCLGISFRPNSWFLFSILLPMLMALVINVISIIQFNNIIFSKKTFIINIIIGLSISAVSALIEELAWRGFLFNELKHIGMIKSSLLIGFIWAVWHTPVSIWYKYPNNSIKGAIINFIQMFVISIIITYIREKSESIFAAAIMHGMFNTMILSSNMDDFKVVVIKILSGMLVITVLFTYNFYKKKPYLCC
ncbi:CPBP family intramembrane metalloprotease [Clostridium estertheticum]|uniref:CPBP family intramembrane glutamic endopeptidase n=1 Tax=Clostridium estertheticum TaxID=238834 RepID=UPI0013EE9A79|nr:CPBP family intramembrane glutamic endopeptidase [Clostridium estertheticum]MBZ9608739.1 CPBP family intramembrane metalloprotease [Clostridium estertheticum]